MDGLSLGASVTWAVQGARVGAAVIAGAAPGRIVAQNRRNGKEMGSLLGSFRRSPSASAVPGALEAAAACFTPRHWKPWSPCGHRGCPALPSPLHRCGVHGVVGSYATALGRTALLTGCPALPPHYTGVGAWQGQRSDCSADRLASPPTHTHTQAWVHGKVRLLC